MRSLIVAVALMGAQVAQAEAYKGYAIPPYQVVAEDGAFELRDYGPHLVAEITTTGGPRAAVSSGFRALAGYIFGKNATGEKIAMTAPVTQVRQGEAWVIRFMLPPGRDLDELPKAKRDDIRFARATGGRHLVLRFSGRSAPSKMQAAEGKLMTQADQMGLQAAGPAQWLYYDDPMTLPFRRRNEVALPVR